MCGERERLGFPWTRRLAPPRSSAAASHHQVQPPPRPTTPRSLPDAPAPWCASASMQHPCRLRPLSATPWSPSCIHHLWPLPRRPCHRRLISTALQSVPHLHPSRGAPLAFARFYEKLYRTEDASVCTFFICEMRDASLCIDFCSSVRC